MCVLFLYLDDNPQPNKYRLIIANNRDEEFDRSTKSLDYWDSDKNCLSGQDLQSGVEGCTWLGMSKIGKVGVLLNIKEIPEEDRKSRGCLVRDFLSCDLDCQTYIENCVKPKRDSYNGFHLVLLDCRSPHTELAYFNNRDSDLKYGEIPPLFDNCLGLGNSLSARTPWQKVEKGKKSFMDIIGQFNQMDKKSELTSKLLEFLKDKTKYSEDPVLRKQVEITYPNGNEADIARNVDQFSPLFVNIPERRYGTRTHSIITVDYDGQCEFMEKTLHTPVDENNFQWVETILKFKIGM